MFSPELGQLVLKVELLRKNLQEPAVPLVWGKLLADESQVQQGHPQAFCSQASRGPNHQGALARLTGGQDITEVAGPQRL